ncbi:MAG: hypothetical protein GX112_06985 [Clostridiaceae bacterium]|nr:hypothetical protein [Clostridiaceae bacterium]
MSRPSRDTRILMRAWVRALTASEDLVFTQELHPQSGALSKSSAWYSSSMLFYLHAVRRLGQLD